MRSFSSVLVAIIVLGGCSTQESERWQLATGTDGGFSVRFPVENDVRVGQLVLGEDTVETHVVMTADSGVTYIAAWYELPELYRTEHPKDRMEAAWNLLEKQVVSTPVDERGPLGEDGEGMRNAWFITDEGVRLGALIMVRDMRVILLTTSIQEQYFTPRVHKNMVHFLRSLSFD